MTKKVDFSIDLEDLIDFYLIGITTENYLYKTGYELNKALKIKLHQPLMQSENHIATQKIWWTIKDQKNSINYYFEWLTYQNDYEQSWDLISNKSFASDNKKIQSQDLFSGFEVESIRYLLPQKKIYNQLLLLPQNQKYLDDALIALKQMQGIQAYNQLPIHNIKNIEELVINKPRF